MDEALKIIVNGRVQGVGFRPFIFQLAEKYRIKGTVQNNMDGVQIKAEGSKEMLTKFLADIKNQPPRLSRVDKVSYQEIEKHGFQDFSIIESDRAGKSLLVIPVDSAVCDDCLAEMNDPDNFRYRYPFINCTQCGPRYTIIDQLPYDRPYTVMNQFDMCDKCKLEYENPLNRRHHAQPTACPECGPEVKLLTIMGNTLSKNDDAVKDVQNLLAQGYIVAVKGLGGYHLACDAYNETAVETLRKRKKRPNRPLAVMTSSLDATKNICYVSDYEEQLLRSPEAPIVVMEQKKGNRLPEILSPGLKTLGVMLPYTPLHHLLFENSSFKALVMTSANPSGLPILYQDDHTVSYLKNIADYILINNREILHPLDDSVVQGINNKTYFLRRSRGYVPDPFTSKQSVNNIIALGGQQKNTFAIGRNNQIFLGPHIGDMENLEIIDFFQHEMSHLKKWMGTDTEVIAIDKHPEYATAKLAQEMKGQIVKVQHHHAHHVSCMEDNNLTEPCLGIIFDGTGYGDDGNIWGYEFLYADAKNYSRLAHLQYTPLPGNEMAVKEPWRNAVGMLIDYFENEGKVLAKQIFPDKKQEIEILSNMIKNKINSPPAGTCGRLFDAVSAILNVCRVSTYDGEAAVKLSEIMPANINVHTNYPYMLIKGENNLLEIDFSEMLREIVEDYFNRKPVTEIVQLFHQTIVVSSVEIISLISEENPDYGKNVVLSGGSFHNLYLLNEIDRKLTNLGYNVFSHRKVPCNDGGLSLGQLIIAANREQY